jgi:hypothetical protein
MIKTVVYYFIEDGQDGSASLELFASKEARDMAMELSMDKYGISELASGAIDQDDIDDATTLDEVQAERTAYDEDNS